MAKLNQRELVFDAFRWWGYLEADLDPVGYLRPEPTPELRVSGPDAEAARRYYCGTIGAEFMHIADAERRRWVAERIEGDAPDPDRERILELLARATIFEQILHTRHPGTK